MENNKYINALSIEELALKIESAPPLESEVEWCQFADGSCVALARFPLNVDRKAAKKFADLSHDVISSMPVSSTSAPLFNIMNFPDRINIDKFIETGFKLLNLGNLYEAKGLKPYNIAFIADVGFGPTVWNIGKKIFFRNPDALLQNIEYTPDNQKMLANMVRQETLKNLFS